MPSRRVSSWGHSPARRASAFKECHFSDTCRSGRRLVRIAAARLAHICQAQADLEALEAGKSLTWPALTCTTWRGHGPSVPTPLNGVPSQTLSSSFCAPSVSQHFGHEVVASIVFLTVRAFAPQLWVRREHEAQ